jgi:hypothetical protein
MRRPSSLGLLLVLAVTSGFVSPAGYAQAAPTLAAGKPHCYHQPAGSPVVPTREFDTSPQNPTHKLENPLRRGVQTQLMVLALGDSAMWGNGVANSHKYVHLVAQYVANQTGRAVKLVTYAHSGANIADGDSCYAPTFDSDNGVPPGDLNAGLPTILQQEGAALKDHSDAELVLLDGCINDVSAYKVAMPFLLSGMTSEEVSHRAHRWCSDNMLKLLQLTEKDFPLATVIVSNYWLIISEKSSPVGIAVSTTPSNFTPSERKTYGRVEDLLEAELKAEKELGRQVTDVSALADPRATFKGWSDNSYAFLKTTQTCFDWAVATVDGKTTKPNGAEACPEVDHVEAQPTTSAVRAFLAKVSTEPQYSYGAGREKRVWSVPGIGHRKDEVYKERAPLCESHYDNLADAFICHVNPTAHPNVPGADAYHKSITRILATAWAKGQANP